MKKICVYLTLLLSVLFNAGCVDNSDNSVTGTWDLIDNGGNPDCFTELEFIENTSIYPEARIYKNDKKIPVDYIENFEGKRLVYGFETDIYKNYQRYHFIKEGEQLKMWKQDDRNEKLCKYERDSFKSIPMKLESFLN